MDGLDPVRRMAFIHQFFQAVSKHGDPVGAVNAVCPQGAHREWGTPSTGHENLRRGHKGGHAAWWWGVRAWRCGQQARLPRRTEEGKTGLGEITGHRENAWKRGQLPGRRESSGGSPGCTARGGWRWESTERRGTEAAGAGVLVGEGLLSLTEDAPVHPQQ